MREQRETFLPIESYDNPDVRLVSHAPSPSVELAARRFERKHGFDPRERASFDRTKSVEDYDADMSDRGAAMKNIEGPHAWGIMLHDFTFSAVTIDPMISEIRWRTDITSDHEARNAIEREATLFSFDKCRARFWDRRREIEAWVDANAKEDLLVQPTETGFRFMGLCHEDRRAFSDWLARDKEHEVKLALAGARFDNILRWVKANVKGAWFEVMPDPRRPMIRRELVLMIRDQKDAVHTKLRWSDPEDGLEPEDEAA
jgi:hypothetical protein